MYPKGGNMLHTIRALVADDARWRGILRGVQRTFRHQTVSGQQVQDYISREAGLDLSKVFAQYLTTTMIPSFEYRVESGMLWYRWANVVAGFDMPLRVELPGLGARLLRPTEAWQSLAVGAIQADDVAVDENFYVTARNVGVAASSR
jgi:hypothetical protein